MEACSDPLTPAWGSKQNMLPAKGTPKGAAGDGPPTCLLGSKEEAVALGTVGHGCTL